MDVGTGSHLGSAAQQHTHLSAAHLGKKFCFFVLRVCIVDEINLLFGHTSVEQLGADIIIDIKAAIALWRRHIAEDQLGQLLLLGVVPDAQDIVDAGIQLAVGIIGQRIVHEPLVKADLAAIRGDFQHIIHRGVNGAAVNFGSTFAQRLHHVFLDIRGLDHHRFKFGFRDGKMQLVAGLDICRFLKHRHQLREVEELGKTGARTVASALRSQFNGCCGLAES